MSVFLVALVSFSVAQAQVAQDQASNYPGGTWSNTSVAGTGFGAWTFESSAGTGFAGVFVGDPFAAGITGMSPQSFGLYANPANSGAFIKTSRSLLAPLLEGQTFSFQLGMNWDSGDPNGNKGFNLMSGGIAGTQLLNINMASSPTVSIQVGAAPATTMFSQYGTTPMTLNLQLVTPSSLRVYGTGRNGSEQFDQTFTVAAAPDSFAFYASGLSGGTERQLYFNDLTVVPEPSVLGMLLLSAVGVSAYRLRSRMRHARG